MPDRLTLASLNEAEHPIFAAALDGVFEHAPWVAEAAFKARPFATVAALHEAMMQAVLSQPREERIAFVKLHPDLAGKAARAGDMAPDSVSEQAGLGFDRLSDAEYERFERLNADYRWRFGFPFVICVRRQTRDAVLAAFETRLDNRIDDELDAALAEIGYITRLRLVERVDGPGAPVVAGRLTTHVLDTVSGGPAQGVAIHLFEIGRTDRALLKEARTNSDGRTDEPLLGGGPLRIGTYEIVFHLGPYFAAHDLALPQQSFLNEVPVRFGIVAPEADYHVPLIATPWSYATYRGS